MAKMKWTRMQVMVGRNRDLPLDGCIEYTSGPYKIVRREYTIPCRSVGYTLLKDGQRLDMFDTLADAKEYAAMDMRGE
jgi:hypothetical protein